MAHRSGEAEDWRNRSDAWWVSMIASAGSAVCQLHGRIRCTIDGLLVAHQSSNATTGDIRTCKQSAAACAEVAKVRLTV